MTSATDILNVDPPTGGNHGLKKVEFVAGFIVSLLWLVAYFNLILSESARARFEEQIVLLAERGGALTLFVSLAAIGSYFGILVFRVHQHVYDHYAVQWRKRHDAEFVLPKLFAPFEHTLRADYYEYLSKHSLGLLDGVFCPFLNKPGQQIEPRLVMSFYRWLSAYWITQIIEMALILWCLAASAHSLGLGAIQPLGEADQARLISWLQVGLALLVANGIVVRKVRRAMRKRALAEIVDIKTKYPERLAQLVASAAQRFDFLRVKKGDVTQPAQAPAPSSNSGVPGLWDHAFVSAPMSSLAPAVYLEERQVVLRLLEALRSIDIRTVYYGGEAHKEQHASDDALVALKSSLQQIRKSGVFVFLWPTRVASSALLELGYALALGKPILMLVRSHAQLPYTITALAQLADVTECSYRDAEDIERLVKGARATLFGEVATGARRDDGTASEAGDADNTRSAFE